MTTQVVFNTDKKLKAKVMAKCKKLGISLSVVLNIFMRDFVDGKYEFTFVEVKK